MWRVGCGHRSWRELLASSISEGRPNFTCWAFEPLGSLRVAGGGMAFGRGHAHESRRLAGGVEIPSTNVLTALGNERFDAARLEYPTNSRIV